MKSERKPTIALFVIKCVAVLYDVLSYPFYYLAQQPWSALQKTGRVRAVRQDVDDPYSPYVRVGQPLPHYLNACKTIPEAQQKSLQLNGRHKPSLGYRQVLGEEKEVQSNGRVFTKWRLTDYQWLTLGEVDDRIGHIARGLLANGVKPRDNVLLFAETSIEWFLCGHAIVRIGASIATLYATLGEDGIIHGINETEVTHIITSKDLLKTLSKLSDKIARVTTIIYIDGFQPIAEYSFNPFVKLMPLSELESAGKSLPEDLTGIPPNGDDIAVILYTSGSTGAPKGVILTHKNFMASVYSILTIMDERVLSEADDHRYLGYLPLAHSLEFVGECFMFSAGVKIGYGTPFTLTDSGTAIRKGDKGDVTLLRPTVMAAVPLILDRIRKGIFDNLEKRGPFAKELFNYAMKYKIIWERRGFSTPIINYLFCRRIRSLLGGELRYLLVGGAPLSPDTQKIMKTALNVKLLQGYGATETCAAATIMDFDDLSDGLIGAPLYGAKLKLIDWEEGGYRVTDKPNPRGEVIVGGDFISKGYYKLEDQTRETFEDKDGLRWFNTGDIGEVNDKGQFKIIDRKKDLVKLQFGEYISLGKVEAELKNSPFVDNVCVYGDSFHLFTVALVVPNSRALKALAQQLGNQSEKLVDWCADERIVAEVTKAVAKFGADSGLNKMEIPAKIKLCSEDWTPANGLQTAALKLKRKNIQNFYQSDIDRMYGKQQNNNVNSK